MSTLAISPQSGAPVVTPSFRPAVNATRSGSRRAVERASRPGARRSMNAASAASSTRRPTGRCASVNVIRRAWDAPHTDSFKWVPNSVLEFTAGSIAYAR